MRIIQKAISLEPITSRVPSIWPAYKDNKLYFFDDISLKSRGYEYPTNYGMIPLSLSISSSMTESDKVEYNITCEGEKISFERLSNIYSFFRNYNNLLNNLGHCGRVYSSAVDYYNTEIDGKYGNELEYGTNIETYIRLDEQYYEYGGEDFSKWINDNVIPTYEISEDYRDYWKRNYLYYSDVIKWIAWFEERKHYETEAQYKGKSDVDVEHWDCKLISGDCCDCEEYFKRGGERELGLMLEWYKQLQDKIKVINQFINNAKLCFEPKIIENIELVNSLYNIGQFSELSPEYELGIDYRTASGYGESENTKSGTTVIDESGNTRILKDCKSGFCFSPFYMEKIFDDNAWDNYLEVYINQNPQQFASSSYTLYTFDENDRMYVGDSEEEIKNAMISGESYDLISTNSILIDDALIPIETSEYGIYDPSNNILGGRIYFVYREKDTSTPYTLINGKKIYAESYLSQSGLCYYFSFFRNLDYIEPSYQNCNREKPFDINKYQIFGRTKNNEKLVSYISYNDKTYIVEDKVCLRINFNPNIPYSGISCEDEIVSATSEHFNCSSGITINDIFYYRIKGYTYDKYGNILYVVNDSNTIIDSQLYELPSSYTLSDNGKTIYVNTYNDDTIFYNAKEITGHTSSKLLDLESNNKLCDDIGNDINGIYNDTCREINGQSSAMTYAQPPIYTVLEPLYQVGNTSLIGRFKLTKDNISEITDNTNYFIGNIITKMIFYYNDVNGNKTAASAECSSEMTSLSAISTATSAKNVIDESNLEIIFDENLYCDIEYYMGATLKRNGDSQFTLADGYNYGVKYNETVKFIKTPTFYGLKMEPEKSDVMPTQKYETDNLPHKYIIYTYEIAQNLVDVHNDIYDTFYKAPIAKFMTEINLFDSDGKPNFSDYRDMDKYNGLDASPIYKDEYKLGIGSKEKIDSDIYIDRGINAAFEKHLKLGEVVTLEALLNMGNGYFKIMDN